MNLLKEKENNNSITFYTGCFILLVSLGLLFALMTQTNIYCDDFRYATFFKDGLGVFWENTKNHYLISNGRVFVHILIPLVLIFKSNLYMFLFPLILLGILYYGIKIQGWDIRFRQTIIPMALGIILFLGMSLGHFRSTVFWISGCFNYIFPVFFVLITLFLLKNTLEKNKNSPLVFIMCFLAGATTEQCGAMAIIGFLVLGFMYWRKQKTPFWVCFLPFIISIIGYCTILAAPGTDARIAADGGGELSSLFDPGVLRQRFSGVFHYFIGEKGYKFLGLLFPLGIGLLPFVDKNKSRFFYIGIPIAFMIALCYAFGQLNYATVLFLLFAFVLALYFLKDKVTWGVSSLLFMLLVSQVIMMFTTIFSYRTAVPGLLLLILLTAFTWGCILNNIRPIFGIAAFAAFFLFASVSFLPILQGCAATNKVFDENIANLEKAKVTGEAHLTVDFDDIYGYALLPGDGYYHYDFRKAYNVDESTQVYLEDPDQGKVYANGVLTTTPSFVLNHKLYFPLNPVMNQYNIATKWHDDGSVTIPYGKNTITLTGTRAIITDENGTTLSEFEALTYNEFVLATLYLEADAFETLFQLKYSYDSKNNSYTITLKE